ncbi:hypothetical protein A4H97_22880 [Niastella yeongjuensis]|uniref:RNA polymerase subunit sigma-24 n=1 Tax=Niastella yeongjuensis TaxID=354355 RepID=A0A1V9F7T3_9BACT|nr:sigma-70 family RNA polymerase sigma factor [Niastella yeongjuensis]OQP54331.1 hypothetical protein A4H97_22880 [Niastella yeongjuensis]SEP30080.1 RNA polymerase sigma-70 factor, ECF subfamily [Niastella yeongjuensis]
MDNKLDRETITGFQQGDPTAFQAVYRKYYVKIKMAVVDKVGSMAEAEDITAEAFKALYERHPQFDSESYIRRFLYTCVRNRVINYWKRKQLQIIRLIELGRRMNDDALQNNEFIKIEVLEALHKAIESLPEECRKVFKMLFYDGLTPAEVADILQIPIKKVYRLKAMAQKILRIKLGDDDRL